MEGHSKFSGKVASGRALAYCDMEALISKLVERQCISVWFNCCYTVVSSRGR